MLEILIGILLFVIAFLKFKSYQWAYKDSPIFDYIDLANTIRTYGGIVIFVILGILLIFGVIHF